MKQCAQCKEFKSLDEFWHNNKSISSYCRPCHACRSREYWRDHPDKSAVVLKKRKENGYLRLRQYGITPERFESVLIAQEGICGCCSGPPGKMGFHVDHNHETGVIRGLLCSNCNTAIGLLHEDPERFQMCIDYLKRFQ